jgi:hypothetical protein
MDVVAAGASIAGLAMLHNLASEPSADRSVGRVPEKTDYDYIFVPSSHRHTSNVSRAEDIESVTELPNPMAFGPPKYELTYKGGSRAIVYGHVTSQLVESR